MVRGRCVTLKRKKIGGAFDHWRENRMSKILIRTEQCLFVHGSFYFNINIASQIIDKLSSR